MHFTTWKNIYCKKKFCCWSADIDLTGTNKLSIHPYTLLLIFYSLTQRVKQVKREKTSPVFVTLTLHYTLQGKHGNVKIVFTFYTLFQSYSQQPPTTTYKTHIHPIIPSSSYTTTTPYTKLHFNSSITSHQSHCTLVSWLQVSTIMRAVAEITRVMWNNELLYQQNIHTSLLNW